MTDLPRRLFGRTQRPIPFLWKPLGPNAYGDDSWCALEVGPEALDRKADSVVIDRLAAIGRTKCDVLIVQDLLSNDLKVGWPTHRLMQIRDRGLCSYFAVETHLPLESEWITTNAPIHAIVAPYTAQDMALRYRTFDASHISGVAIVSRAATIEDLRLQLATPHVVASIPSFDAPAAMSAMSEAEVESLWNVYQPANPPPAKLRSGHPPDYGV